MNCDNIRSEIFQNVKNDSIKVIQEGNNISEFITAGTDKEITFWKGGQQFNYENQYKFLFFIFKSKKTRTIHKKKSILKHLLTFIEVENKINNFTIENKINLNKNVFNLIKVKWDKDDTTFVITGDYSDILVVDSSKGLVKKSFKIHEKPFIRALAQLYINDDILIMTGGDDCMIKIWNLESEEILYTLKGHQGFIRKLINFGDKIISCSDDKTIRVWDAKNGVHLETFLHHASPVNTLIKINFPNLENTFASGDDDSIIKIWDLKTKKLKQTINVNHGYILTLEQIFLCENVPMLASGDYNSAVRIFNIETSQLLFCFNNYSMPIWSIKFLKGHNTNFLIMALDCLKIISFNLKEIDLK